MEQGITGSFTSNYGSSLQIRMLFSTTRLDSFFGHLVPAFDLAGWCNQSPGTPFRRYFRRNKFYSRRYRGPVDLSRRFERSWWFKSISMVPNTTVDEEIIWRARRVQGARRALFCSSTIRAKHSPWPLVAETAEKAVCSLPWRALSTWTQKIVSDSSTHTAFGKAWIRVELSRWSMVWALSWAESTYLCLCRPYFCFYVRFCPCFLSIWNSLLSLFSVNMKLWMSTRPRFDLMASLSVLLQHCPRLDGNWLRFLAKAANQVAYWVLLVWDRENTECIKNKVPNQDRWKDKNCSECHVFGKNRFAWQVYSKQKRSENEETKSSNKNNFE